MENQNVLKGGLKAPKDPTKKRKKIYLMADAVVDSVPRGEGKFAEIYYLEGRVEAKVSIICPDLPKDIVDRLATVSEFRKIVHSIGITVTAEDENNLMEEVEFVLQTYGKPDKYNDGSLHTVRGLCNGAEFGMDIADWEVNPNDTILGTIYFNFNRPGIVAKASVFFYLNDGYDVPEPVLDPPIGYGTENYKKMFERAVLSYGNTYRVKKAFAKAEAGEEITVAFIGGSITQGAGAKPQVKNSYAAQTYAALKDMLKTDKIRYVKGGVGGTSSEFGMVRYERDILADGENQPDIVVIEFAVNDEGDETNGISYESLINKILKAPNAPAVVLLFAVFMNDYNLEDRLVPIGRYYDLPLVSVKACVVPQFTNENERVITKRQYFYDLFHPSNDGHCIMKDCLMTFFRNVYESMDDEAGQDIVIPEKPYLGRQFEAIERLDRVQNCDKAVIRMGDFSASDKRTQAAEFNMNEMATTMFTDNWMKIADAGTEAFEMEICCKAVVVVYKDEGDTTYGKADVYCDGEFVRTLDPLEVGWNHCNTAIALDSKESAKHVIRIKMHEGDEKKAFTILGFGIVF